jgi:hypothetical protein
MDHEVEESYYYVEKQELSQIPVCDTCGSIDFVRSYESHNVTTNFWGKKKKRKIYLCMKCYALIYKDK